MLESLPPLASMAPLSARRSIRVVDGLLLFVWIFCSGFLGRQPRNLNKFAALTPVTEHGASFGTLQHPVWAPPL